MSEVIIANFITKEYTESLKKAGLYEAGDAAALAKLTRDRNIRGGKGYSGHHIRNFILRQHTTTQEMVALITDYYSAKKSMREKLVKKQNAFINELAAQQHLS